MRLTYFLYPSRHGVFYFRWPLPSTQNHPQPDSVRLSLGTRCPRQAGELARFLASCGELLRRRGVPTVMRHDELRAVMHRYFKQALAARIDQIGAKGPPSELDLAPQETTRALAEGTSEDYWGIIAPNGIDAFLQRLCGATGLPELGSFKEADRVLQEYKMAHRDFLRALVKHQTSLEHYDFTSPQAQVVQPSAPPAVADIGITLQQPIDYYVSENKRAGSWRSATFEKKEANLALLTEYFGADRPIGEIAKRDAQDIMPPSTRQPKNPHR